MTILKQIVKQDCFDGQYANIILEAIGDFLKPLDDKTIIALWQETETGMCNDTEDDFLLADWCCMDLEMELLQEITNMAWEEAKELKKSASSKGKFKKKGYRKENGSEER